MEKEGIFIDNRTDKIVEPNQYFDSDMWADRRWEAALYVQRLVRGWFARRKANAIRKAEYDDYQREIER